MNNLLLGTGAVVGIIAGVVLFIILIWGISTRNTLKRGELKIDEACSGIEIALTKRYDVLTKLFDIAKGYAKHEKETYVETIKMRSGMTVAELNETQEKISKAMSQVYAVAENYPQLKANEQFKQLQVAVMDTEEHLQASRRLYNSNVNAYNAKVISFPSSIIASMCHCEKREFFVAEERKLQDVKFDF